MSLKTLFSGGKGKRQQHCLLLCEDRCIEDIKLKIDTAYMVDDHTFEAWHLVHNLLMPMQGSQELYQIVGERNALPLNPFDGDGVKDVDVEPIAREEFYRYLSKLEQEGKKNVIASAIKFAVVTLSCLFCLVILMTMYSSGKFVMPW